MLRKNEKAMGEMEKKIGKGREVLTNHHLIHRVLNRVCLELTTPEAAFDWKGSLGMPVDVYCEEQLKAIFYLYYTAPSLQIQAALLEFSPQEK